MTTTAPISNRIAHTRYVVGAWTLLVAFTGCTWRLGAHHDIPGLGRQVFVVTILVLTFAKVYVVGNSFMELRQAARWLTLTFTIWCVALCTVLSFMYLSM
jgi:hypothetical protein